LNPYLCGKQAKEGREMHKILAGKHEGKRPLGRHGCRLEGNIKMDVAETGWEAWSGFIWLMTGYSHRPL